MSQHSVFTAGVNPADTAKKFTISGQAVRVLMHSAQSESGCFCFEQSTPPGFGVPPHMHSREDEIAHILEGQFEIRLGDETFMAGPGDTLNFARGTLHGFTNVGSGIGRTTWTVTPGAAFEAFFEAVSNFPPGPPDFDKLDALHKQIGITMPRPRN
jgi:quercetin dioxygenase-like cupin family protein